MIEEVKKFIKEVDDLIYIGKYDGNKAYLLHFETDIEIGEPLLCYERNGGIEYVGCLNDEEANKLYKKYVNTIED